MKKRIAIITIGLLMMIPAVLASASSNIVSVGASQVKSGETLNFSVDLSSITAEDYTVSVSISPDPDSLTVSEHVSATINGGACYISSANLDGVSTLHFEAAPGEVSKDTNYSISVVVTSDGEQLAAGSANVTALAAEAQEETESPEQTDGDTSDTKEDAADGKKADAEEPKDSDRASGDDAAANGGDKPSGRQGQQNAGSMKAGSLSGSSGGASGSAEADSKTTYTGSANNYLKSLSVSGYELTQNFHKTNDTYFVTAEDVTSVTVKATAEDADAVVIVTGTDSLSQGRNKILVNVTAANGDVRVYRIYVDVK